MKKLVHYFESEKGKRLKNTLVCFGASVVLAGALFKIMHWPGAGAMLTAGMLTEVFLFAMFGFLPPHKEYYWEKLNPNLDIHPDHDPNYDHAAVIEKPKGSVSEQLDEMMESANVSPSLIESLGEGLKKFSDNTAALSNVADASIATNEYTEKTNEASRALSEMKEAYSGATDAISGLSAASEGTREYHEQLQKVANNLSQLNSIYEVELQDTNNHMKTLNSFYGDLSHNMESIGSALNASMEDTKRFQSEMSSFANNLASLNAVYGNMLSAMNAGVGQQSS